MREESLISKNTHKMRQLQEAKTILDYKAKLDHKPLKERQEAEQLIK